MYSCLGQEGHIKGLNEADDELINVNLADAQRTAHLKKVKARAKLPAYSGVHDEFGGYDQDTAEGAAAAAAAFRAVRAAKGNSTPARPLIDPPTQT